MKTFAAALLAASVSASMDRNFMPKNLTELTVDLADGSYGRT